MSFIMRNVTVSRKAEEGNSNFVSSESNTSKWSKIHDEMIVLI